MPPNLFSKIAFEDMKKRGSNQIIPSNYFIVIGSWELYVRRGYNIAQKRLKGVTVLTDNKSSYPGVAESRGEHVLLTLFARRVPPLPSTTAAAQLAGGGRPAASLARSAGGTADAGRTGRTGSGGASGLTAAGQCT